MALQVDDVSTLQTYLRGVSDRADHHAQKVKEIVYPLVGAIVQFKDPDKPIEVFVRKGEAKNALWVWIGGKRYLLSYDHRYARIDLRVKSTNGKAVAHFDDLTPTKRILAIFSGLAGKPSVQGL